MFMRKSAGERSGSGLQIINVSESAGSTLLGSHSSIVATTKLSCRKVSLVLT